MTKIAVENKWEIKKIKEVGRVVTGKTPPTRIKEYFGKKFPFITPTHIIGNSRFIDHPARYLSDKGYEYQRNLAIPSNTVCFTCIGSTVGKMAMTNRLSFTNQQINSIIVDSNIADYRYIFYLLKTEVERIKNYAGGAAKPIVSKSIFEETSILCPPLPIQHKIASILSAYDDLIELNERRIKILEEMARLIYKEWFVKFRFPGYEKVEMVKSELGMIPEGWKVKRLNEAVNTQYGYTESAFDEAIGPKFLRVKDINKNSWIDWSIVPYCKIEESKFKDYALKKGDIVVARMADPGKIGIVEVENSAVFASYLIRLSLKTDAIKPYYLFYYLTSPIYQNFILGASTGTTRASANAKVIIGCDIVIPPGEIMQKFETVISKVRQMMSVIIMQNNYLRQIRNMLLPKLISGEIDVSDLNIKVEQNA